ncbi:circumsporozoite protein-like [Momordica charantia]|uniref:Circumsporozoite protein-like n=1 Tax=Momordica charantia TaxID=3673 RepID=A0A6J1CT14_MOMCH|nr:circumsporozoite protein-like [Momordica charantia]
MGFGESPSTIQTSPPTTTKHNKSVSLFSGTVTRRHTQSTGRAGGLGGGGEVNRNAEGGGGEVNRNTHGGGGEVNRKTHGGGGEVNRKAHGGGGDVCEGFSSGDGSDPWSKDEVAIAESEKRVHTFYVHLQSFHQR